MKKFLQYKKQWIVLLLMVFLSGVAKADGVWLAKKGDQQIIIAAVISAMRAEQWPLPDRYQQAYNNSTRIVLVDSPIRKKKIINKWIFLNYLFLPETDSLSNKVSDELMAQLINYREKNKIVDLFGLPLERLAPMTACAELYLNKVDQQNLNFKLTRELYRQALWDSKDVILLDIPLKTIPIMKIYNNNANEYLTACLHDMDTKYPTLTQISETVYKGDMEQLNSWHQASAFSKLTEHNQVIEAYTVIYAKSIDSLVTENIPTVIYMDIDYLQGDKGLLNLLKEKGYKISKY